MAILDYLKQHLLKPAENKLSTLASRLDPNTNPLTQLITGVQPAYAPTGYDTSTQKPVLSYSPPIENALSNAAKTFNYTPQGVKMLHEQNYVISPQKGGTSLATTQQGVRNFPNKIIFYDGMNNTNPTTVTHEFTHAITPNLLAGQGTGNNYNLDLPLNNLTPEQRQYWATRSQDWGKANTQNPAYDYRERQSALPTEIMAKDLTPEQLAFYSKYYQAGSGVDTAPAGYYALRPRRYVPSNLSPEFIVNSRLGLAD